RRRDRFAGCLGQARRRRRSPAEGRGHYARAEAAGFAVKRCLQACALGMAPLAALQSAGRFLIPGFQACAVSRYRCLWSTSIIQMTRSRPVNESFQNAPLVEIVAELR